MVDISFEFAGSFDGVGGNALSNPTSLQFGPDGRLYVTEQTGSIIAFTIENQNGTYVATDQEILVDANGDELVRNIQNHFDDGSLNNGDEDRQVTGLVVAGTADEPILYISSSDPNISNRGEVNLDTNSGILSRATFDSQTGEWQVVDLVRGLPRSEENHAVNGLSLDEESQTLLLQVGGNTNNGAPSDFFSFANEFVLSGAVLEIDLAAIDALPVLTDADGGQGGTARSFVYDLPTLDDPNIENVTDGVGEDEFGLDEDGPFGGNDGLNQAILPADAPLRIFADGLRNAFDIAVTPNGNIFTVDNGSNTNLGGGPNFEIGDEDGDGIFGEAISTPNSSPLGEAEPLFNIVEGGFFFHSNPLRSNQNQSFTVFDDDGNPDQSLAVNFVEDISELVPEGVDIADGFLIDPSRFAVAPGVTLADVSQEELEARLLLSGITVDRDTLVQNDIDGDGAGQQVITTLGSSSNGIVAFDSNGQAFNGALDGALFVTQFNGNLTLLNINDAGTDLDPIFNSGDDGIFGTADDEIQDADGVLQVANSSTGAPLTVPLDVAVGPDGTLFIAEIGSSEITVVAPSSTSPITSIDADGDGIINALDPFLRDAANGTGVVLSANESVIWDFDANQDGNRPGTDGFGGGLTGVLINGETDFESFFQSPSDLPGQDIQLDNVKFITAAGGGTTVIENVSNGEALGAENSGEFLFHTGLVVDPTVDTISLQWVVLNPGDSLTGGSQQLGGYIGTGDQDNYLKVVGHAGDEGEINVVLEIDGVVVENLFFQADDLFAGSVEDATNIIIDLSVDVETGLATPTFSYETTDGGISTVETVDIDLSNTVILDALLGEHQVAGQASGLAVGLYSSNSGAPENASFQAVFQDIEVTTTGETPFVAPPQDDGEVLYRINAGGNTIAALDDGPDWLADTSGSPSPFLANIGSNSTAGFNVTPNADVGTNVPAQIFASERWDRPTGDELEYAFEVADGVYEVRLYLGNGFSGTSEVGERVFDVAIEGVVPTALNDLDLAATLGHQSGGVFTQFVEVADGELNIDFLHGVENPLVNGIEILQHSAAPAADPIDVSIVSGDQTVSEGDSNVNISLLTNQTVPVGEQIDITYSIQGVSAELNSDFAADESLNGSGAPIFTGTATIPGGSSDFQLAIDILDDALVESNETFVVTLESVSGGATIGVASSTITIEDNDASSPPPPSNIEIVGTSGDDVLFGTAADETYLGNGGEDVFSLSGGDDVIIGDNDAYSQINTDGFASDYLFERNADGTVTVTGPEIGTSTLTDIDGVWFRDEAAWFSIDSLIETGAVGSTISGTAGDDILFGTAADETYLGNGGEDVFSLSGGNDVIIGDSDAYSQINTDGFASDYLFERNADGTVNVSSAQTGTDTLTDIDGVWFRDEAAWFSIDSLIDADTTNGTIAGTDGDDILFGTSADETYVGNGGEDVFSLSGGNDAIIGESDAYSQINTDGFASEYTFTRNADGTVNVASAQTGTDTLTDIDGVWFRGEEAWFSIDSLI